MLRNIFSKKVLFPFILILIIFLPFVSVARANVLTDGVVSVWSDIKSLFVSEKVIPIVPAPVTPPVTTPLVTIPPTDNNMNDQPKLFVPSPGLTVSDVNLLINKALKDTPPIPGPQGPRGFSGGSNNTDTSSFISQQSYDKQVNGLLTSIENNIEGLSNSLGEHVSTDLLTVLGNATVTGNLTVTGTTTFNTVTYSWTGSQGVAGSILQNDGTGALSWVT